MTGGAKAAAAPVNNPWLVMVSVSLATFMEVLDTTITNVSLPHIGGSLAASQDQSTWVMTSYLVSNAIILPLSGWLADVIGRKKYFMLSMAGFTLASFFCGSATSLWMIIVFRLLQGMAGGGLQPTQSAILLDVFSVEDRPKAFALAAVTMIVAPVIGPTLGGFITDNVSWRWIFFINVPVGMLAIFLVNRLYHEHTAHEHAGHGHASAQKKRNVDYFGFLLIALGIGATQIILDKGTQDDWFGSNFILGLTVLAVAALAGAVWWMLRQENPMVQLRLFGIPSFRLSCILIFFMGFVLYSSSILLPLLVQTYFGYDATWAGLVLSPGALAVILMTPLTTRLIHAVKPRYIIMTGFLLCGSGVFYTAHFSPVTDIWTFVTMRILTVSGLPFLFIPISTMAYSQVSRHMNNKASALYSLCRNLGGSFGISLVITYFYRHTQMWQTYLGAHLTATSLATQQALAHDESLLKAAGVSPSAAPAAAKALLYQHLQRQAGLMGYVDSFRLTATVMLLLAPVALLMRGSFSKKAAAVVE
ncbi:MAG: DHA2 family efflux MFS transporter permease subunit [Alphaproteobacteria bacterium]|nr:DHA2 family efflux MFS transporter permease subunit [Alphaproteobacteria bacterium]